MLLVDQKVCWLQDHSRHHRTDIAVSDFEDRKSPSLLSPAGTGPSPWIRSALNQNSPVEPPTNTLVIKRTNTLANTSESHDLISPSTLGPSHFSSQARTAALSLQTRDIASSNFYRRPAEINSARPTYNRIDSFAGDDDDDHRQPERKSLSSWNTPPTGRGIRQGSYGTLARHMANDIPSAARRPSRPEQSLDFLLTNGSWSSTRQPFSQGSQGQRTNSYTTNSRRSNRPHQEVNDLENRFVTLDMADEAQYAATSEQWHAEGDSWPAYTMQGYGSGSSSVVPQDALRGSSLANWRTETVPRSFDSISTRQQEQQRGSRLTQSLQTGLQSGLRETVNSLQHHFQHSLDYYPVRQGAIGADAQAMTGMVQYDGNVALRASQHDDLMHFQQFYQHMNNLRAQGFLPAPYGYTPMAYGGLHNYSQPSIFPAQRLPPSGESEPGLRSQLLEEYLNSMKNNGKRYELRVSGVWTCIF